MLNEVKRLCKGKFEDLLICKSCNGSGEKEHYSVRVVTLKCKDCNGTGKKLKDIKPNGKYIREVKLKD